MPLKWLFSCWGEWQDEAGREHLLSFYFQARQCPSSEQDPPAGSTHKPLSYSVLTEKHVIKTEIIKTDRRALSCNKPGSISQVSRSTLEWQVLLVVTWWTVCIKQHNPAQFFLIQCRNLHTTDYWVCMQVTLWGGRGSPPAAGGSCQPPDANCHRAPRTPDDSQPLAKHLSEKKEKTELSNTKENTILLWNVAFKYGRNKYRSLTHNNTWYNMNLSLSMLLYYFYFK